MQTIFIKNSPFAKINATFANVLLENTHSKFSSFWVCFSVRYSFYVNVKLLASQLKSYEELVHNLGVVLLRSLWVKQFRDLRICRVVGETVRPSWQTDWVWLLVSSQKALALVHQPVRQHFEFALAPCKLDCVELSLELFLAFREHSVASVHAGDAFLWAAETLQRHQEVVCEVSQRVAVPESFLHAVGCFEHNFFV